MIETVEAKTRKMLDQVNGQLAIKDRLTKEYNEITKEVSLLQEDYANNEEARIVIAATEATQQEQLKQKLERLISLALTSIFDRTYKFRVQFSERGSQAEVTFKVEDDSGNAQDIKDAHGGGLLVIASFMLRIIVLLSSKPALRPILCFDEPFIQVSEEYREKLVEFIQMFAKKTEVQFIFVTHEPQLADIGDKRYRFRLEDGITKVEEF